MWQARRPPYFAAPLCFACVASSRCAREKSWTSSILTRKRIRGMEVDRAPIARVAVPALFEELN